MNALASLTSVRVVVDRGMVPDPDTAPDEKSSGNIFPGGGAQAIDAEAFRAWFAPKLGEWLRTNFASPRVPSVLFDRDIRTVENWWDGRNTASGDAVALVFLTFPGAVGWFMAEWAREGR